MSDLREQIKSQLAAYYEATRGITTYDSYKRERDTSADAILALLGGAHHYYFATFSDDNVSQTTDTEPVYRRWYTILRGPYSTAEDAWGDGTDEADWESVCVMRWTGADHTGTCYEPFSDDFDDFMPSELDDDALFETIRAAGVTKGTK